MIRFIYFPEIGTLKWCRARFTSLLVQLSFGCSPVTVLAAVGIPNAISQCRRSLRMQQIPSKVMLFCLRNRRDDVYVMDIRLLCAYAYKRALAEFGR